MTPGALDEEVRFYQKSKADLVAKSEGKWALIKGDKLLGVFDSPDRAYAEGVSILGNVPMLIVPIVKEESRPQVPALSLGVIRASLSA